MAEARTADSSLLEVLHIPCLGTVLTHCFSPTLCTAPSHPRLGGPVSFSLPQLHFSAEFLGVIFSHPLQQRHLQCHLGNNHEQSLMARRLETRLTAATGAFQHSRSFGHLHGQPMLLEYQHPSLLETRLIEETLSRSSPWSKMSCSNGRDRRCHEKWLTAGPGLLATNLAAQGLRSFLKYQSS